MDDFHFGDKQRPLRKTLLESWDRLYFIGKISKKKEKKENSKLKIQK
jgi:hypothetical protein